MCIIPKAPKIKARAQDPLPPEEGAADLTIGNRRPSSPASTSSTAKAATGRGVLNDAVGIRARREAQVSGDN